VQVAADYDKLAKILGAANVSEIVTFSRHKVNRVIRRP
jgi:hypothetical protein